MTKVRVDENMVKDAITEAVQNYLHVDTSDWDQWCGVRQFGEKVYRLLSMPKFKEEVSEPLFIRRPKPPLLPLFERKLFGYRIVIYKAPEGEEKGEK